MNVLVFFGIVVLSVSASASTIGLGWDGIGFGPGLAALTNAAWNPVGPSGIVSSAGASGPSGVVTGTGAVGPSGVVTGRGAIGPTGLSSDGLAIPAASRLLAAPGLDWGFGHGAWF